MCNERVTERDFIKSGDFLITLNGHSSKQREVNLKLGRPAIAYCMIRKASPVSCSALSEDPRDRV